MTQPTAGPGGRRDAEAGYGISTYRNYNQSVIAEASTRIDQAQHQLAQAHAETARHEQVKADLADRGVAPQTSAGMDHLIESAAVCAKAAQNKIAAAEQERAAAQHNLSRLDSGGHTATEQSIKNMRDPAQDIGWYQTPQ